LNRQRWELGEKVSDKGVESERVFSLFFSVGRRPQSILLLFGDAFFHLLRFYLSSIAATTLRHIGSSSTRSTLRPAGKDASVLLMLWPLGPAAAAATAAAAASASPSFIARRPSTSPPPGASDGLEPAGGVLGGSPVLAATTAAASAAADAVASIERAEGEGWKSILEGES
jgi:hypothetical protein